MKIAQANLELERCYGAIKAGVKPEAMAEPINELHERTKVLKKGSRKSKRKGKKR